MDFRDGRPRYWIEIHPFGRKPAQAADEPFPAHALVTAAGGRVSDVTGAPIDYRASILANERGLVVSSGLVHEAIVTRLQRG
jgi:3'-phosphoadenosine 5'-phosphosulfate (PAPS) 3'-phosphatase